MRFWFDTEFYEDGRTVELISIGVIAEDGRTLYAEVPNALELADKTRWLSANVAPHLTQKLIRDGASLRHTYQRWQIAGQLIDFMGGEPEIWAYYADYDWVALCQLFGRMIDLPKGWPMFCRDVKQYADMLGNPALPVQSSTEHHALADARWTKEAWAFCKAFGSVDNLVC
jgi:hypothetical protein